MTQLTENVYAVEVPEGVLVIIEDDILKVGELKNITYLTPPAVGNLSARRMRRQKNRRRG